MPAWADGAAQPAQMVQALQGRQFDIRAQPLADALAEFGRQSGLRVTADGALVRGLSAPAVTGAMSPEEALRRLLDGTGLAGRFAESDLIIIERVAIDDSGSVLLAPVTVLGSRQPDAPLSNVPSSITFVENEEIQEELATTNRIDEVIARKVPGFNPTNNGVRQIRGRTAQVFINGVPTNEQMRAGTGSDLNLLLADQVSDIEVSRGANSAYGFGSPGGIIALQTPRAKSEELTMRTVLRESFNPGHVNGSSQASLYQSASQIIGDFDFQIGGAVAYDGAEYDPDGDLALGFDNSALLTNGKEWLYNLDTSLGLDLGDAGSLRLTGTFGYVDFTERYALNPGIYREEYGFLTEEPLGGKSFRRSYTVDLAYENEDVLGSAVKLELFTSDVKYHVFESFGADDFRQEWNNTYYGVRSSVTTPLDLILEGVSITYGIDALRNELINPYYNHDTGQLVTYFAPDVTLDQWAPYAQLEIPFSDFVLSGGVRHERYSGHVEEGDDGLGPQESGDIDDFDLTLFNAGLVYSPIEQIDLYATFSQGAEITQLGRAARDASDPDQIDPRPAKSNQYELGMRGRWHDLELGLAGFYTESKLLSALECNGIDPCTPLREPREFWGVEANADWQIDEQWGVGGIFTWQDGIRELEDGEERRIPSRDVPPILVTAYVEFSPFDWWRNRLQLNYRAERDPFGDSVEYGEGRVEDLFLLNASMAFDVGPGELRIGAENLLNETYTSIPSESDNFGFLWIPEEGTRVFVSYAVRW
ncbi:TonB-dependent receptor domain-containing protein [Dongia deserti]|uniref:TonB-dependent receptor domain-containing protein n=1 Tax=Dongia deserti TaxID=2268030 RepID=UPI0013C469C8|nr:TonB-dependent receptor [Dongia deserti]